ncbi:MAG: hypothetical protein N3B21_08200 [Clostridia bacterium]|nr:hypothetical protein [Clostridia bacterium]
MNTTNETANKIKAIVNEVSNTYKKHTEAWFDGLIVHGSAVKGGFIPGCSDIDFKLYLRGSAFNSYGKIPIELGLKIQKDLSSICPKPFRYIQCDVKNIDTLKNDIGLISGTYQVVSGTPQINEATNEQLIENAKKSLENLKAVPDFIIDCLVEHGGERLSSNIRLLCTKVWPILYSVLVLEKRDALYVWNLPKDKAIQLTDGNTPLGKVIREFYNAVVKHYPNESSIDNALEVIKTGVDFLEISKVWWAQNRGVE